MLEQIIDPLLKWYASNKRDLPFRNHPTPYHIWISEIMLQQTRMETVIDYYNRFIVVFPNVYDLASAEEEKLLKMWEGLGYYQRARNLQKSAKVIVEQYNGVFPNTYEEIISLPGIGDYTAGAILSIAFKRKYPAIDGNVLRVLSRIIASERDITETKTKAYFYSLLIDFMPEDSSDFNQALMELGALICIPNGEPKCIECPLKLQCKCQENEAWRKIPIKKPTKKRKKINLSMLLIQSEDFILLQKRKEIGVLKGMYELPQLEGHKSKRFIEQYLFDEGFHIAHIEKPLSRLHIFTHLEWHMKVYLIAVSNRHELEEAKWYSKEEVLNQLMLPSVFRKLILELVCTENEM